MATIARFFRFSLEIEFNALRFINYIIPRLCPTHAVATVVIEFSVVLMIQNKIRSA